MPLAMLTGRAPELISDPLRSRPVAESDVVLVDARDLDPAERDALAASQVQRVPAGAKALRLAFREPQPQAGLPALSLRTAEPAEPCP